MSLVNSTWVHLLNDIMFNGQIEEVRGTKSKELLSYKTVIDMERPILHIEKRGLSHKFMFSEAAWILSGDNKVGTIKPYNDKIARFSDDGFYFFGAYGPKVVDQLSYVVSALLQDKRSRRAVINIWRENPRDTLDYPCTTNLQFLIRPHGDGETLHVIDTMRSSDAWLGIPYDWFNMSMIGLIVRNSLVQKGMDNLKLGTLTIQAGSQHLYDNNWTSAVDITGTWFLKPDDPDNLIYPYKNLTDYFKPYYSHDGIVSLLWRLADKEKMVKGDGIRELKNYENR